ncbi:MAG: hypothetical protein AMXMBFR57_33640 [Acidimicrobiia bacterium]|jgi:hypothetical protein
MTDLCCREVSEFLLEYFEETLPADVKAGFDAHIDGCTTCATFLIQYRDTIIAGQLACKDAGIHDCPEDLVKAVMNALGKEPR